MTYRFLLTTLAAIGLTLTVTVSADTVTSETAHIENSPITLTSLEENKQLTRLLATLYPDSHVRSVRNTPITNFFEVTLATSVAYIFIDPEALKMALAKTSLSDDEKAKLKNTLFRYWYFGGVFFDMKTQSDLTRLAKNRAERIDVATLPINQAIVRTKGTPKHSLYVFTDPLCPYCRKLEETLDSLTDVRIYTFLSPLVTLHPEAREVAARIWCTKNPAKAFDAVMLKGETLTTPAQCETPILKKEALMQKLGIKGTPTLFLENGERLTGAMTLEALQKALENVKSQKEKTSVKENPS